jgi:hypothetical protein
MFRAACTSRSDTAPHLWQSNVFARIRHSFILYILSFLETYLHVVFTRLKMEMVLTFFRKWWLRIDLYHLYRGRITYTPKNLVDLFSETDFNVSLTQSMRPYVRYLSWNLIWSPCLVYVLFLRMWGVFSGIVLA